MLCPSAHDIDAGCFNTSVAEDIRELCNILIRIIKGSGEQLSQIMGINLFRVDLCFFAQVFHLQPYAASVQWVATAGDENWAGTNSPPLGILQQALAQLGGDKYNTVFILAADLHRAGLVQGFHCKVGQL